MLSTTTENIVADKSFQAQIEQIILKNVEDELYYRNDDLQICLIKCNEYEDLTKLQYNKKLNTLKEKLSKCSFHFNISEKLRQQIHKNETKRDEMIKGINDLRDWLDKAVKQNQGSFKVHNKELVYAYKSLNILTHKNRFRKIVVWITEWSIFDSIVITFIIIGSTCQVLQDFSDPKGLTQKNKILFQIMEVITIFFIFEAFMKIISQGLINHKNAYLRNNWNLVDFCVVISSIIEIVITLAYGNDVPSFKMLRALRVFRPLRTFKRVPSMRRLVSIMLRSIPDLGNTIAFMVFFFIVFGIIGIQVFNGAIYQRCRLSERPVDGKWLIDPFQANFICSDSYKPTQCRKGTFCGSPMEYPNELNAEIDNPWQDSVIDYNTNNYNNLLNTMVLIFEALTLEGWSIQVKKLVDSGQLFLAPAFFLLIIAFGSYFLVNLILAVIMGSFSKFENREIQLRMKQAENQELLLESQKTNIQKDEDQEIPAEINDEDKDDFHKQMVKKRMENQFTFSPINNQKTEQVLTPFSDIMNVNFDLSDSQDLNQSKRSFGSQKQQKSANNANQQNIVTSNKQYEESDNNAVVGQVDQHNSMEQLLPQNQENLQNQEEEDVQKLQKIFKKINKEPEAQKRKSIRLIYIDKLQQQIQKQYENIKMPGQMSKKQRRRNKVKEKMEKSLKNQFQSQLSKIIKTQNLEQQRSNASQNQKTVDQPTAFQNMFQKFNTPPALNLEITRSPTIEQPTVENMRSVAEIEQQQPMQIVKIPEIPNEPLQLSEEDQYSSSYERKLDNNSSSLVQNDKTSIDQYFEGGNKMLGLKKQKTLKKKQTNLAAGSINSAFDTAERKQTHKLSIRKRLENWLSDTIVNCSIKYSETTVNKVFNRICNSSYFQAFIILCIAINTLTLSLDRYPIESEFYNQLEFTNNICTFIFVAEMFIKILGLGLRCYLMDGMNQFDASIVIISLTELALTASESSSNGNEVSNGDDMSLTIFRGFRLLRVFRLARNWNSFHKMMVKIGQTIKDIINFFVLLLVIVSVFALLGVELFNNYLRFNGQNMVVSIEDPDGLPPVQNFDSFENSFVSIFVCLIGEDWQSIMHNYTRAHKNRVLTNMFFVILMIIGNLFLMNLFLAILLKNFEQNEEEEDQDEEDQNQKISQRIFNFVLQLQITASFRQKFQKLRGIKQQQIQDEIPETPVNNIEEENTQEIQQQNQPNMMQDTIEQAHKLHQSYKEMEQIQGSGQKVDEMKGFLKYWTKSAKMSVNQRKLIEEKEEQKLQGNSLFIFKPENCFRLGLQKVVSNNLFEMTIFTTVIASAICMMLEQPLSDPQSSINNVIHQINLAITIIFMIELILKIMLFGFIMNGPYSYLRDGWNCLDSIIVIVSIIGIIMENMPKDDPNYLQTAKNLELIKMLRVLRSIRLISRSEGLKLSVISLIHSMPGIFRVTIVSILCYLLFGIFFLNMLKGRFYHCEYNHVIEDSIDKKLIVTMYDCINYGGTWRNEDVNFDSITNSAKALFIMSTNEGWVDFMNQAVDSTIIGQEPKRGNNPHFQYFFIAYMIFGSLFITNLFIYVVINTFQQQKSKIDKNYLLTSFQKEWIQIQLKCYKVFPQTKILTDNPIRQICLNVSQNEYFDQFIMFAILVNAAALSMVWNNADTLILHISERVQYFSNIVFISEAAIKIIAQNKFYFKDGWNRFDFMVVCMGILSMSLDGQPWLAKLTIFRILRVCRVLRLLKKAKRLYRIFNSFLHSIPAFMNVGSLIMVLIFIFSCLGNRLFAKVMIYGSLDPYLINFMTFENSFFTLLTVMTGEGWYNIMADVAKQKDIDYNCQENTNYEDYVAAGEETVNCGNNMSALFFILYVFWCSLILVNLFIAVTLQGFQDVQREDSCRITDFHIERFMEVWADIDPDGTGYIHISQAGTLMRNLIERKCDLFPPKSRDLAFDTQLLSDLIEHLNLKLYKDFQFYNFHDILISLSQMYISYLSSKPKYLTEVLNEYQKVNKNLQAGKALDLDDVIVKIDEIQQNDNVAMCKQLDNALLKFKNNILCEIDRFDGQIYTSSMIPIVIKIQQLYRERRKKRMQQMEEEAKHLHEHCEHSEFEKNFLESSESEEGARDFLVKKQKNQIGLKTKLDSMILKEQTEKHHNHIHVENSQESLMPQEMQQDLPNSSLNTSKRNQYYDDAKKTNLQIIELCHYQTYKPTEIKYSLKLFHNVLKLKDTNENCRDLLNQINFVPDPKSQLSSKKPTSSNTKSRLTSPLPSFFGDKLSVQEPQIVRSFNSQEIRPQDLGLIINPVNKRKDTQELDGTQLMNEFSDKAKSVNKLNIQTHKKYPNNQNLELPEMQEESKEVTSSSMSGREFEMSHAQDCIILQLSNQNKSHRPENCCHKAVEQRKNIQAAVKENSSHSKSIVSNGYESSFQISKGTKRQIFVDKDDSNGSATNYKQH